MALYVTAAGARPQRNQQDPAAVAAMKTVGAAADQTGNYAGNTAVNAPKPVQAAGKGVSSPAGGSLGDGGAATLAAGLRPPAPQQMPQPPPPGQVRDRPFDQSEQDYRAGPQPPPPPPMSSPGNRPPTQTPVMHGPGAPNQMGLAAGLHPVRAAGAAPVQTAPTGGPSVLPPNAPTTAQGSNPNAANMNAETPQAYIQGQNNQGPGGVAGNNSVINAGTDGGTPNGGYAGSSGRNTNDQGPDWSQASTWTDPNAWQQFVSATQPFQSGTPANGSVDSVTGQTTNTDANGNTTQTGGNVLGNLLHPGIGPGGRGPNLSNGLYGAGYNLGQGLGALPSGMADAINNYGKNSLNNFFGDYGLSDNISTGKGLLDPGAQAAADAAEKQQLDTGIDQQRQAALRDQLGRQNRGGQMGSGGSTGIYNAAMLAQQQGDRGLAQDQFGRMIQRNQLGTSVLSDAARQKNGIMNDNYTSGGDIAGLLMNALPQMSGDAISALQNAPGSQAPWGMFAKFGG